MCVQKTYLRKTRRIKAEINQSESILFFFKKNQYVNTGAVHTRAHTHIYIHTLKIFMRQSLNSLYDIL